jgi:hypothetical protein
MPSKEQIKDKIFIAKSIIVNGIDYPGEAPEKFENLYVKWSPEVK